MSGFADLLARANPAALGGGCNLKITENRDLARTFTVRDSAGNTVDMTGATGTCVVLDEAGNTLVALTFTPTTTGFTITASNSDLAGLAGGLDERTCTWKLSITKSGQQLQGWSANNSNFEVWGS